MAKPTIKQIASFGAAAVVLAGTVVMGFEGLVTHVYPDPATKGAPWSYCFGETSNPQFGHTYTRAECEAEFRPRIAEFAAGVDTCISVTLPDKVAASFISMAYNVGLGAFCKSTLVKKANAGDLVGACNQLPSWNRAAGKVMRGLTIRRGAERGLCLEGVAGK